MTYGSPPGGSDSPRIGQCSERPGCDEPCWRYELEYDLDHGLVDHRPEHEAWLLEWSLECLEVERVQDVSVSRREDGYTTTVAISIETTGPGTLLEVEGFSVLFDQLVRWVGDVTLRSLPTA